jgi:hypothetical protein
LLLPQRRQPQLMAMDDACFVHSQQVTQVPHLHATNVYPSNTLAYKKIIYITKRHKNYICKQKKTTKVETYPSPLAPHQEAWVSMDL